MVSTKIWITADIKEKLGNQEEVLCVGGMIHVYLPSLSNKWTPCHEAINSLPRNLRSALEKYFRFY